MSEPVHSWETEESRQIADCRVFKVREDTAVRDKDGHRSSFFVIESPDWVNVVALTTERMVLLIEQFPHGTKSVVTEIPGGMVDAEESIETAAARELLEETGFAPKRLISTGKSFPNPAIQNNTIHHFLALDCEKTHSATFDDHESIATRLVPLDQLEDLVQGGAITHSLAVTAIYYANRYLRDENIIT